MSGWIGVDLDGTLAEYHDWSGPTQIGAPIPKMVERVKQWYKEGKAIRIFTARAYPLGYIHHHYCFDWTPETYEQTVAKQAVEAIRAWCTEHLGFVLPITCIKDYQMYELWDDRAIRVKTNTGEVCCERTP